MTQAEDEDRWLAVLSGVAPPADDATRQAQQYRDYLHKFAQEDLQDLDEASYVRSMNWLRAQGAFRAPAAPAPQRSAWAALLERLLPRGHAGRYALVAAVLFAVVLAPLVLRQPDDDASQIKRLPAAGEAQLAAPDPARLARDIENTLIAHGVVPTVQLADGQAMLSATVGAAEAPAVRAALQPYGVQLPADGRLRIRIRRP